MEAIPSFKLFYFPSFAFFFFPVFIHRLENIKVLSKLDPGRTNSLRNSCIQCHISDSQVSGFPSLWMVTMWGNSDTSSQCTLTFVVCDENVLDQIWPARKRVCGPDALCTSHSGNKSKTTQRDSNEVVSGDSFFLQVMRGRILLR